MPLKCPTWAVPKAVVTVSHLNDSPRCRTSFPLHSASSSTLLLCYLPKDEQMHCWHSTVSLSPVGQSLLSPDVYRVKPNSQEKQTFLRGWTLALCHLSSSALRDSVLQPHWISLHFFHMEGVSMFPVFTRLFLLECSSPCYPEKHLFIFQ